MKEMFLFMAMLPFSANILFAQTDRTWAEKYNGEEYTLEENEYCYVITNKKYYLTEGNRTSVRKPDKEDYTWKKIRKPTKRKIDKIANEIFHLDQYNILKENPQKTQLLVFCGFLILIRRPYYAFTLLYSSETVSFFLPLARREANTLRPLADAILSRKPCLFFLFLLEGWNVLFISISYFYVIIST